jgi:hypothetical protein
VVLFDAFYSGEENLAQWIERGARAAPRRLVSIYSRGGGTGGRSVALAERVSRASPREVAVDPPRSLRDAVATHRVVVMQTGFEHIWLALLYVAKVLAGLGLPAREPRADDARPTDHAAWALPRASGRALRAGDTVRGELTADDVPLRDGARADEYPLEVSSDAPVVITARGGPSRTEYRAPLDTYLEVLRGGRVVAADDDGAPNLGSRVEFTPDGDGVYALRVTTFGPGMRLGPYALELRAGRRR